mmetsp:Transcript_9108/g.13647  ORF Transcript_9108/g.13647 Transcript_9108/m.13647 type:complete len:140 (+) Transcript_9108:579-998(+)
MSSCVENFGASVVVVDSVSALFRTEYNSGKCDFLRRSKLLFEMAQEMKRLSDLHNIPFVVVNQVSFRLDEGNEPTLGLTWSNCINSRFYLMRERGAKAGGDKRQLCVEMCPYLPKISIPFFISSEGVVGRKNKRCINLV